MWIRLMSHLIPSWIWHILILMEVKLKGEFPGNIFQLPNAQELWLSYDESLTSSFPRYNWTSPFRVLCLSSARFLIDIPYLTRNLKYLSHLDVSNCKLRGPFSALHGKVTQISTSLDLSPNNFGGQIPWDSLKRQSISFVGDIYLICFAALVRLDSLNCQTTVWVGTCFRALEILAASMF